MNYYGNNRRALFRNYGKQVVDLLENPLNFLSQNRRNNMPPVRTPRRERTTNDNPFYTPRRTSISSASSRATTNTIGGRVIRRSRVATANPKATNVISSALKKKGKKVKNEGRKKKVKISPRFKKMVNQVLSQKGPVGLMMETCPDTILHLYDNEQTVAIVNPRSFQGVTGWKFTPTYINYVYDKLYCNGTFPASHVINVDRYSTSFNDNQQIHVLEQYYVVKMKNNTARTLDVKLWDISPKSIQTPIDYHDIIATITDGLYDSGPVGVAGSRGTQGRENPSGVSLQTIGFKPTLMTSFNKNYALDETIIKLEPGKEYYHKVKGPNDKLYKFNQFKKNGTPYDVTKFCKTTLVCASVDMTGLSLQGGNFIGRYTDMSDQGPFGLLIESTQFTKIKCPDQTGFQRLNGLSTPAVGTVQELSQKGYAYVIKNWYDTQENKGTVVDIEDENPQAQAVNGL